MIRLSSPGTAPFDPQRALDEAIKIEALAQKGAAELMAHDQPKLVRRFRQALVQRALQSRLEEKLTTKNIPEHYLEEAYQRTKRRYDHYDVFFFRDMLLICCTVGSDYCLSHQDEYEDCFTENAARAQSVYDLMVEENPKTADQFEKLFSNAQGRVGTVLRFQTYSFYFDVSRSYDKNVNVKRFTRPITDAALKMKPGEFYAPIRDEYGWHVVFLEKHIPETSKTLSDPEVRTEISNNIYTKVQGEEFRVLLNETAKTRVLEVHQKQLVRLATWLK